MADAGRSKKRRKRGCLSGIIARISGKHGQSVTPQPNVKTFKRSRSLEKDMVLLSAIGLLQESGRLREAVLILVRLKQRNDNPQGDYRGICAQLTTVLQACATVCIWMLAHSTRDEPQRAQQAIDEFHSAIALLKNFDHTKDGVAESLDQVTRGIHSLTARHALPEPEATEVGHPIWKAVLAAGITVLDILKEASEAADVPVLKGVVGSVLSLFKAVQQTQFNYNDMYALACQAGELVINVAEACSSMGNIPEEVERLVLRFEANLRPVVQRCQELSQKNVFWCFLQNSNHKQELDKLAGDVTAAVQLFQNSNLIQLQVRIERVAEQVDHVAFKQLPEHPDVSALRGEYFPGSREDSVKFISDWFSKSKEAVLWLHGPAGMGKSTLAHHCVQELRTCDRLAASAFITAIPSDNLGPETLVKMLASEIGKLHPHSPSAPRCSSLRLSLLAIARVHWYWTSAHGVGYNNSLEAAGGCGDKWSLGAVGYNGRKASLSRH
ncbi:hypothetical protein CC2G_002041 [Coprinopsis cinerea AmutBmut pab1-1]|nr:hypothetical protein CC2G_002041 [Coprinopsis cinerea AmutBmut pab1-1]